MEIRLIGCGAMGSAIAKCFAQNKIPLSLYDQYPERAEMLASQIGAKVCRTPLEDNFEGCLLLAVKPQNFQQASADLKMFKGKLLVSILSGMKVERLKKAFPNTKCLQMMPNIAVAHGKGAVALLESPDIIELKPLIEKTFAPLGYLYWIPERLLDGATALTGSGPAFILAMVEAMIDAAVAMGFSAKEGSSLIQEMIGGTLSLLRESNKSPSELRWQITSPEGTTIAGLRTLEEKNVRSGVIETFLSAYKRSKEMGD